MYALATAAIHGRCYDTPGPPRLLRAVGPGLLSGLHRRQRPCAVAQRLFAKVV